MKKQTTYLLIGLGIILLSTLLYFGFQDQKDPYWSELDKIIDANYQTLDKSQDSISTIYNNFQHTSLPDTQIFKLISKPFVPGMEFSKLKYYFNNLVEKKYFLTSSVTGCGTTTLTTRLANLIGGAEQNQLMIRCSPAMDYEFHKQYIGYKNEQGKYIKGELLSFWGKCIASPKQNFVCVIDNFDKINPETFFGPEIWEKLDYPKTKLMFGEIEYNIPSNFYMIMITHPGVGNKVKLSYEHFRRFGGHEILDPSVQELIIYVDQKKGEISKNLLKLNSQNIDNEDIKKNVIKLEKELSIYNDKKTIKEFTYFFKKSNDLISEKYNKNFQLGQWSDVRKKIGNDQINEAEKIFITHVNNLEPEKALTKEDFSDIDYTLAHDGAIKNSYPIALLFEKLKDYGFLNEFGIAITFGLGSAIAGFVILRRRKKFLQQYKKSIFDIHQQYESGSLSYDATLNRIVDIKNEVNNLVLDNKMNYQEGSYFLHSIEEQTRSVENARNSNQLFLKLLDTFLEDGVLSEGEHFKLLQFLETIRYSIPEREYLRYKQMIDDVYQKFGENR